MQVPLSAPVVSSSQSTSASLPQPQRTNASPSLDKVPTWSFITNGYINELRLNPDGESLDVIKISEVVKHNRTLADEFDLATAAMRFEFQFEPSNTSASLQVNKRVQWSDGIQVNVDACASMGMSERFCGLLTHGSDLLLTSVPPLVTSRDNYKSALEELDAASENVDAQIRSGVLEFPASDV